jgi:hypothetical protein
VTVYFEKEIVSVVLVEVIVVEIILAVAVVKLGVFFLVVVVGLSPFVDDIVAIVLADVAVVVDVAVVDDVAVELVVAVEPVVAVGYKYFEKENHLKSSSVQEETAQEQTIDHSAPVEHHSENYSLKP